MIDVYATTGTFFVHDLPLDAISNAAGDSNYVRVQVLTPVNVHDRDKQLGVVKELSSPAMRRKQSTSLPVAGGERTSSREMKFS